MREFIVTRFLQLVVTMFIVSLLVFLMIRLRGDPISIMAPPIFNQEQIDALRAAWGFDKPVMEQYVIFLRKAVTGDFGKSFFARRPAMEVVIERLGNSWLLAGVASLIGLTIAVPLGILSALETQQHSRLSPAPPWLLSAQPCPASGSVLC